MHAAPRLIAFSLLFAAAAARAEDYTLFNPTPDDKLRAFTTERPSKTDSSVTVDAGRVQVESSLYSYTNNNDDIGGGKFKSHQSALGQTTNVRIGLTENSDFQIIADLYRDFEFKDVTAGTPSDNRDGFGDTLLRYKYSFAGNKGETWAVAAIPFVKLPTNQNGLGNDNVEYGFAVPVTYTLPDGWSLASEPIVQALKKPDQDGFYTAYTNSIVAYKTFTPEWSGYAEYYAFYPDFGERHWQNTADFGVIYAVNDNLHLDTGVNIGTTEAADDLNAFVGAAYRF